MWHCRLTANVLEGSTVLFPAEVRPSQREGAYEVSFEPEISGVYRLAVYLEGGRALNGSPFPVRAKTDETVAANCKMYGGGLTRAVAGQETSFTIQGLSSTTHTHRQHCDVCPCIVGACYSSVYMCHLQDLAGTVTLSMAKLHVARRCAGCGPANE